MVTPFQLAWTLLKAMPPMVPRDLDEQIGVGTFRTVYGRPGVPHVTKYGSGEGLANALLLERMSSTYPDVFEPEELHVAPREIAPLDFLMRDRETGDKLQYQLHDDVDVGPTGKDVQNRDAIAFTQRRGRPLESPEGFDNSKIIDVRNRMYDKMPIARALRMWDLKPQNVAQFDDDKGIEIPEYKELIDSDSGDRVRIIDPQFNANLSISRPSYTDDFMRDSREFQSDLPTMDDYTKDILDAAYNSGDPRVIEYISNLIAAEKRQLDDALDFLNP